jgi:hypothetical protein
VIKKSSFWAGVNDRRDGGPLARGPEELVQPLLTATSRTQLKIVLGMNAVFTALAPGDKGTVIRAPSIDSAGRVSSAPSSPHRPEIQTDDVGIRNGHLLRTHITAQDGIIQSVARITAYKS